MESETKTIVQTFLENETTPLIYDNDSLEQWGKLIEELNLKGQNSVTSGKSPIPFMYMKKSLVKTFETLCPVKTKVEEYDISTIPLKVLELIKLSKGENYFSHIEIWYDDIKPDPVCVGVIVEDYASEPAKLRYKTKSQLTEEEIKTVTKWEKKTWDSKKYLIARWGDVKYSFDKLREMAILRYVKEETIRLKELIKINTRELEDLEIIAQKNF